MTATPAHFTLTEALRSVMNTTDVTSLNHVNGSVQTYVNQPPTDPPPLVMHAQTLRAVYIWVLVIIGLPANTACLVTVVTVPVAPYYVALLAVADTAALLVKFLFHQLITYRALTTVGCYFYNSAGFLSCYVNWVLALICFERYLAVCKPYKKQEWLNKTRMIVIAVVFTVFLCAVFSPTFVFFEAADSKGKTCLVRESFRQLKDVWNAWIIAHLYFTLPFLFVSVFTVLTVRGLQDMRRRRQKMRTARKDGPEHTVSMMMVGACVLFLVLTFPATLYHLGLKNLFDSEVLEQRARSFMFYIVVTFLSDITHAVNFFVYCVSAVRFRNAFMQMLQRCLYCKKTDARGKSTASGNPVDTNCAGDNVSVAVSTMHTCDDGAKEHLQGDTAM